MGRDGEDKERKLISIAATLSEWTDERKGYSHHATALYGVADDGSLWKKVITDESEWEWEEIETIPK